MANPSIKMYSGDPTEAGVAGTAREVRCWGQLVFYPRLDAIGGGAGDWVEWRIQRSYDNSRWHDVQVIGQKFVTTPGTDEDPADLRTRYTGTIGAGIKPSIMIPNNSSWVRVFASRSNGAGASTDLNIVMEVSGFGQQKSVGA